MAKGKQQGNGYESERAVSATEVATSDGAMLAMSSETPVRAFVPGIGLAMEILVHERGAVRLDRLNDGAAVLVNHDPNRYAGRVTSARIDDDRRLRGEVAFADTEDGAMLGRNVPRGFLDRASIGFRVHAFEVEEPAGADMLPTVRATDWEPFELSFVSVPADVAAGVGRSLKRETIMSDDTKRAADAEAAADGPEEQQGALAPKRRSKKSDVEQKREIEERETTEQLAKLSRSEGERQERERASGIRALAKQFQYVERLQEMAEQAVYDGTSEREFEKRALQLVQEHVDSAPKPKPRGYLDMPERDRQRYSFARVLQAAWAMRTGEGGSPEKIAPHEMSISVELSRAMTHREAAGILIPPDILEAGGWPIPRFVSPDMERMYRSAYLSGRAAPMGVGTAGTQAGALVGTALMAGSFIEALRPSTVVLAAGATVMPGLSSNVSIPKQTGTGTAHWLGEDEAQTETETPIGLVNLTPRSIAADVPITRRMILQSTPAVEGIVRSDLTMSIAEAIDDAALEGDGTAGTPLGIVNHPDALTQAVGTDGSPTWVEAVGFITTVAAQNALRAGGAFITTPTVAGNMMTTSKDTGSGQFVMSETGMVAGFPSFTSSQLATNRIIFGSFSQLLIGQWGVMDVLVDVWSSSNQRRTILRVTQDLDIALRHGQSFAYGT